MRLRAKICSGSGVRITRLVVGLFGGSLLIISEAIARGDGEFDASKDRSPAVVTADLSASPSGANENIRIALKSAMSLRRSWVSGRGRGSLGQESVGMSAAAVSVLPDLQLQRSLIVHVPATDMPKARSPLAGEINREGIVRARRLQIRDGATYLEGDDSESKQGGTNIDRAVSKPFRQ